MNVGVLIVFSDFRIIYQQDVKVHSAEEARDLLYAAQKYNVKEAIELTRAFMLKNFNKENAAVYFEAGQLHDDEELTKKAWSIIRDDILDVVKTRGFFENNMAAVPESFDIEPIKDERQLANSFDAIMQALKEHKDLKKRVGMVLGLVQYLTSKAGLALKSILNDDSLQLQCNLVWKPPTSSLEQLSKIFNTVSCIKCKVFHNPLDASQNCFGDAVKNVYQQYMHTNVSEYKITDIQTLHNALKQYLPA